MRTFSLVLVCLSLALAPLAVEARRGPEAMLGFDDATAERELEAQFDSQVKAANLREWMRRISARPHHLGSAYGRENAEFMAGLFRSWGYETEIEVFDVLFPTPKTRLLEQVAPVSYRAKLAEPPVAGDATSTQTAEQLPTYNCYSADGDVTGDLVFVNYGVPADYERLASLGVDVKGKIVIARYGGSWRGIKPKVAAEHGALGCIIYSDPADDGFGAGDVYPEGAFRNANGVQRGSVADMPVYPGDPQTPGVASTNGVARVSVAEAQTITKIPVLPISYADALPLLTALDGPVAPDSWRGALPITYHIGPGGSRVHLKLEFDWKVVPACDVIAKLPGAVEPDRWVVRGNHHDAWVNGADDPVSGLVAMLEEARVIGELAKAGKRPKRTVVYCAWDGEEQGLLGSTEWVERHESELRDKVVAYINSDSNGRGFLYAGGSPTLEKLVNEVAREVPDPQTNVSVADRLRARELVDASVRERATIRERKEFRLSALGSGSDFTPFLQHLGVASLNIGFGGEDSGGSYHSIYDSFDHYSRFGDPTFEYGAALAKTGGRLVLRLANSDLLPFEFVAFATAIDGYATEVGRLSSDMAAEIDDHNRMVDDQSFVLAADPKQPFVGPKRKPPAVKLDFGPLERAIGELQEKAKKFDRALSERGASGKGLADAQRRELNTLYCGLERALTLDEGLPQRSWYRHFVYAPGAYTGYGVKTFPAIREAIEREQWAVAADQILVAAKVLGAFNNELDRAIAIVEKRS